MATVNLAIVIPDNQVARVQAAVRAFYGQVSNGSGGFRDMTNQEVVERVRQDVIRDLKYMVMRYERESAIALAEGNRYFIEPYVLTAD